MVGVSSSIALVWVLDSGIRHMSLLTILIADNDLPTVARNELPIINPDAQ